MSRVKLAALSINTLVRISTDNDERLGITMIAESFPGREDSDFGWRSHLLVIPESGDIMVRATNGWTWDLDEEGILSFLSEYVVEAADKDEFYDQVRLGKCYIDERGNGPYLRDIVL